MSKVSYNARVRVLRGAGYNDRYLDAVGTVINYYSDATNVGVLLDGNKNTNSQYGCYWFKPSRLEVIDVIEMEETNMFKTLNLTNGTAGIDYGIVRAKFLDEKYDKTYLFALLDNDVFYNEGDTVVVMTGHHGLALATIVSFENDENISVVEHDRQVICKVDMSSYNERLARVKAIKDLKKKMDTKVKQLQDNAIYAMLAKDDPELAEMFESYKGLLK